MVKGRRCLVVGGGRVAARKIAGLLACGAAVTVVAPEVHVAIAELADSGVIAAIDESPLEVQIRPYEAGEAADYQLVIAATGDPTVDDAVHRDAQSAGVWVNVADDPARCSFVLPAVARDGPVSIAVSTAGASPALAGWLRDRSRRGSGPRCRAIWRHCSGRGAGACTIEGRSTETIDWRRLLDGPLPDLVRGGRMDEARVVLDAFLADPDAPRVNRHASRQRSPGRAMS